MSSVVPIMAEGHVMAFHPRKAQWTLDTWEIKSKGPWWYFRSGRIANSWKVGTSNNRNKTWVQLVFSCLCKVLAGCPSGMCPAGHWECGSGMWEGGHGCIVEIESHQQGGGGFSPSPPPSPTFYDQAHFIVYDGGFLMESLLPSFHISSHSSFWAELCPSQVRMLKSYPLLP